MLFQRFCTSDSIVITFSCISDVMIISEFMSIFMFVISDLVKLFLSLIEVANSCYTYCIKLSFNCSAQIAHSSYLSESPYIVVRQYDSMTVQQYVTIACLYNDSASSAWALSENSARRGRDLLSQRSVFSHCFRDK